jgi:hypothetical protein
MSKDEVIAVSWSDESGGTITVEYESQPPSTSSGTEQEADAKAEEFFGRDKTKILVFGGFQWVPA